MILNTELALALRCPECKKVMLYRFISLFQIKWPRSWEITCCCGYDAGQASLEPDNMLQISLNAPCCPESHDFCFNLNELNEEAIFTLSCDNIGGDDEISLAYFGLKQPVLSALMEESADFLNNLEEMKKFFVDPMVIGQAIMDINILINENMLYCGVCKNTDLNLTASRNAITLECPHCNAMKILEANSQENPPKILEGTPLVLEDSGKQATVIMTNNTL